MKKKAEELIRKYNSNTKEEITVKCWMVAIENKQGNLKMDTPEFNLGAFTKQSEEFYKFIVNILK